MTIFLTLEDLLSLAADLGVGPVRDIGLLASAAHRPRTMLWGTEAYPSLSEKGAALIESIVRNHGLMDGNKRLGFLALVVFCGLNGVTIDVDSDSAYHLVMGIASGELDFDDISAVLEAWQVTYPPLEVSPSTQ